MEREIIPRPFARTGYVCLACGEEGRVAGGWDIVPRADGKVVHVVPVLGVEISGYRGWGDNDADGCIGWNESADGIVERGCGVIEGSEAER
jgi:hypothetical protein